MSQNIVETRRKYLFRSKVFIKHDNCRRCPRTWICSTLHRTTLWPLFIHFRRNSSHYFTTYCCGQVKWSQKRSKYCTETESNLTSSVWAKYNCKQHNSTKSNSFLAPFNKETPQNQWDYTGLQSTWDMDETGHRRGLCSGIRTPANFIIFFC